MEFGEVLRRRRMVRNHLPDPIPSDVLESIVAAGLRAPSAGFTQGQCFVVVTDPVRRAQIADLAGEPSYADRGFDPWLSNAPAHVVVCTSEAAYRRRYALPDKSLTESAEWPVPYWWVDAGASLMAILLAAVDSGLAAGFLGAHAIPGLAGFLELPEDVTPLGVVTVGRPAPDRTSRSAARGRRPTDETVHWQRWRTNVSPEFAKSEPCNTDIDRAT